jgi:hypothetical protein
MVLNKASGGKPVVEYLSHHPKAKGLSPSCHHWFWERENGKKVFKSTVFVVAKLFSLPFMLRKISLRVLVIQKYFHPHLIFKSDARSLNIEWHSNTLQP